MWTAGIGLGSVSAVIALAVSATVIRAAPPIHDGRDPDEPSLAPLTAPSADGDDNVTAAVDEVAEGEDPDGPWALELIVAAEPEQPQDDKCAPGFDCLTTAKAYFGGAIRGRYIVPESWSLAATLGLASYVDQEERPPDYSALTLRVDFQLEINRAAERFGAALRASPVAALAWSDNGVAFATDVPGFALLMGTLRYWGELGIRTLPTLADPRGFFAAFGFALGRWSGTAGFGTFATLGYHGDELEAAPPSLGAYGDVTVAVTRRFDIRLMAVLSSPVLLSVGFGWRFAAPN